MYDRVERAVAPRLEAGVRTGTFASTLATLTNARAGLSRRGSQLAGRRGTVSTRSLHFANLPAAGDVTRLRAEIRDLDRRVRDLTRQHEAGTLVGVVSVMPELGWSDHVGQLRLLVDPAHRGQGIGRELARAALVRALELGLSKIIVEVVADQQPAISMFTALGFDPEALLRSHIRDRHGDFRDLIILAHMADENWQTFGATGIDDEIVTR